MKMRLTWFAAMAAVALFFAPRVHAAPNDAQAVRTAVSGFATTWNRHDMVAFGKLFTTDADFVTRGVGWFKGRHDIQMHHAYLHGTVPVDTKLRTPRDEYGVFKNSTMHFNSIDVRFVRKDVAIARVRWELHGDPRTTIPRRGLLMFVLVRQGGQWLITAAQNTAEINRTVK